MQTPANSNKLGVSPKASSKALADAFLTALRDDFLEYGAAVFEDARTHHSVAYLKIIASLLLKGTEERGSAFDAVGDEELATLIAGARTTLALYGGGRAETGEPDEKQSAEEIPSLPETS